MRLHWRGEAAAVTSSGTDCIAQVRADVEEAGEPYRKPTNASSLGAPATPITSPSIMVTIISLPQYDVNCLLAKL